MTLEQKIKEAARLAIKEQEERKVETKTRRCLVLKYEGIKESYYIKNLVFDNNNSAFNPDSGNFGYVELGEETKKIKEITNKEHRNHGFNAVCWEITEEQERELVAETILTKNDTKEETVSGETIEEVAANEELMETAYFINRDIKYKNHPGYCTICHDFCYSDCEANR